MSSQPTCWRRAAAMAAQVPFPAPGARVAVIGCGTSLYVAQAMASWREAAGQGETDAFSASEAPLARRYDVVVAVTRSGTTTEVLRVLATVAPRASVIAITARADSPAVAAATQAIVLDFADEQAVVQTRFATTALALWRARLGHDVGSLAGLADASLVAALPLNLRKHEQFVFLGHGPGVGLANEASLKFREAALAWSESYPAMEFRHGPISVISDRTLVWALNALPPGLADEVAATGATVDATSVDEMVELVRIQRAAIDLARSRGLDPNRPRRLTHSVVLS